MQGTVLQEVHPIIPNHQSFQDYFLTEAGNEERTIEEHPICTYQTSFQDYVLTIGGNEERPIADFVRYHYL